MDECIDLSCLRIVGKFLASRQWYGHNSSKLSLQVFKISLGHSELPTSAISRTDPVKGQGASNNHDALIASTTSEQPKTWGRLRYIASFGITP